MEGALNVWVRGAAVIACLHGLSSAAVMGLLETNRGRAPVAATARGSLFGRVPVGGPSIAIDAGPTSLVMMSTRDSAVVAPADVPQIKSNDFAVERP